VLGATKHMPRATVLVCVDNEGEWELANEWIERWRTRMAVCPDDPDGCMCCVAFWDVDAPQEALDELPKDMLAGSSWVYNGKAGA
jgi:hypothetical protein